VLGSMALNRPTGKKSEGYCKPLLKINSAMESRAVKPPTQLCLEDAALLSLDDKQNQGCRCSRSDVAHSKLPSCCRETPPSLACRSVDKDFKEKEHRLRALSHLFLAPSQYAFQFLQVDSCSDPQKCKAQLITAIATQGAPSAGSSTLMWEWTTRYRVRFQDAAKSRQWEWYADEDGQTKKALKAKVFSGGISPDVVAKHYFGVPFHANSVRLYPSCWVGRSMALRVEVFARVQEFSFKKLRKALESADEREVTEIEQQNLGDANDGGAGNTVKNTVQDTSQQILKTIADDPTPTPTPSPTPTSIPTPVAKKAAADVFAAIPKLCDVVKKATSDAFKQWSLGLGGSGTVYITPKERIKINATSVTVQAFQRRVVKGAGLLVKQLICFATNAKSRQQCCVFKRTKKLGTTWPTQAYETLML